MSGTPESLQGVFDRTFASIARCVKPSRRD